VIPKRISVLAIGGVGGEETVTASVWRCDYTSRQGEGGLFNRSGGLS